MTEGMLIDLKRQYGEHTYDYPNLTDDHIKSVIRRHRCRTFEELDKYCLRLCRIVAEIEQMKGEMK